VGGGWRTVAVDSGKRWKVLKMTMEKARRPTDDSKTRLSVVIRTEMPSRFSNSNSTTFEPVNA
jgi:hypothetical protein